MAHIMELDELSQLTYRQLQAKAKGYKLPSNVKKICLLELLTAKITGNPDLDRIAARVKEERRNASGASKKKGKKEPKVQVTEVSSTTSTNLSQPNPYATASAITFTKSVPKYNTARQSIPTTPPRRPNRLVPRSRPILTQEQVTSSSNSKRDTKVTSYATKENQQHTHIIRKPNWTKELQSGHVVVVTKNGLVSVQNHRDSETKLSGPHSKVANLKSGKNEAMYHPTGTDKTILSQTSTPVQSLLVRSKTRTGKALKSTVIQKKNTEIKAPTEMESTSPLIPKKYYTYAEVKALANIPNKSCSNMETINRSRSQLRKAPSDSRRAPTQSSDRVLRSSNVNSYKKPNYCFLNDSFEVVKHMNQEKIRVIEHQRSKANVTPKVNTRSVANGHMKKGKASKDNNMQNNHQESVIDQQAKNTNATPKVKKILSKSDECISMKRKSASKDVDPFEPPYKRSRSMCNIKKLLEKSNLEEFEQTIRCPDGRYAQITTFVPTSAENTDTQYAPKNVTIMKNLENTEQSFKFEKFQGLTAENSNSNSQERHGKTLDTKTLYRDCSQTGEEIIFKSRQSIGISSKSQKFKCSKAQEVTVQDIINSNIDTAAHILTKLSIPDYDFSNENSEYIEVAGDFETNYPNLTFSNEVIENYNQYPAVSYTNNPNQTVTNIIPNEFVSNDVVFERNGGSNGEMGDCPYVGVPEIEKDSSSSGSAQSYQEYCQKKNKTEQKLTNRMTRNVQSESSIPKLPPISSAFPQLVNRDVTQPIYVQVSEESDRLPFYSVSHLVAENASIPRAHAPFEPLLRTTIASTYDYSTTDAVSSLQTQSAEYCVEVYQPSIDVANQASYVTEQHHSGCVTGLTPLLVAAQPENIGSEPVHVIGDQSPFIFEETQHFVPEPQFQFDGHDHQLVNNDYTTDVDPNYVDQCEDQQIMLSGNELDDFFLSLSEGSPLEYDSQDGTVVKCHEVSMANSGSPSSIDTQWTQPNETVDSNIDDLPSDLDRDALEFTIDSNYIQRVLFEDMDVRMQCVMCNWAGAKITLERHIRKEHAVNILKYKVNEWKVPIRLGSLFNQPLWISVVIEYENMLYLLSMKYQHPGQYCAALSVVSPDPNPKTGSIQIFNNVTGQPFVWKGEIPDIHFNMPFENINPGLTVPLSSLDLLPSRDNTRLLHELCSQKFNKDLVVHPKLNEVQINMFVKVFY